MERLQDRVAVVTGGSSGIGRQISLTYAREGADVVVADLQADPREGGTPTHEAIESETDSRAAFVECDVTDVEDLEAAVDAAEEFGGVDAMVNNAGIFRDEDFLEVTEEEFRTMFDVNVKGVFFGAQAAARRMVESGDGGCIVNLSSVSGLQGAADYVTYCASKGAVRLLTYALASELGPEGVRVNAIHPGVIGTTMTQEDVPITRGESAEQYEQSIPSRRFGEPEEVADAALFLASAESDYVNGESLVVDGGMTSTQ